MNVVAIRLSFVLKQKFTMSKQDTGFLITTDQGRFKADKLVIATGGLSIPKIGATGFGYDIARQFNLPLIKPRAGLVP